MAAYLAYHHTKLYAGIVGDRYGNDPFCWVSPFHWSHCHARPRPSSFGIDPQPPFVDGRDAMFFAGHHPVTKELVIDSVLVLERVLPIGKAERKWARSHPIRHYHFDQSREPGHAKSDRTWIASAELSFVPHPAMPIGDWIEDYVTPARTKVSEYFGQRLRKSARRLRDAQGLYDLLVAWTAHPAHARLDRIPLHTLRQVPPIWPIPGVAIRWEDLN